MPSWRIHRKWGDRLLNFSSRYIDDIIDYDGIPGLHDAGRYDKGMYWVKVNMLRNKFPDNFENAFSYYVLHHILDVIEQKLISFFARSLFAESRLNGITNFVLEVIRDFEIPWDNQNVNTIKSKY